MEPSIIVVVEDGVVVDILKSIEFSEVPVRVIDLDDPENADTNNDTYEELNDSGLFIHE